MRSIKATVFTMLKEAAHIADVIEAAESGYVSLPEADVQKLDVMLSGMIGEIQQKQNEKISSAAAPERAKEKQRPQMI